MCASTESCFLLPCENSGKCRKFELCSKIVKTLIYLKVSAIHLAVYCTIGDSGDDTEFMGWITLFIPNENLKSIILFSSWFFTMRLISLVQEKEKLPIGWQKRKSPVSGVLVYVCGGVHPSADTQSVPLDAGFPA